MQIANSVRIGPEFTGPGLESGGNERLGRDFRIEIGRQWTENAVF